MTKPFGFAKLWRASIDAGHGLFGAGSDQRTDLINGQKNCRNGVMILGEQHVVQWLISPILQWSV